jgi:guanylate kinase
MREPELLIVDGVTGAGKSMLLEFLRREYAGSTQVGATLTERRRRVTDATWEYRFVDEISERLVNFTYTSVGNRYAIDVDEIASAVSAGLCYSFTCANYDIIEVLRSGFKTVVIYVYRPLTSEEIHALMKRRHAESTEDVEARCADAARVLDDYATYIQTYDFVLLNTGTIDDFENQARAILRCCALPARGTTLVS